MTRRTYDPTGIAFHQALESLRTELAELPGDRLETIRLDIPSSVSQALALSAKVSERFRERVAAELGLTAAKHIDRLETTALACGAAHADHLTTTHGTDVEEMIAELSQTRRVLLLEAQSLVTQHHLSSSVLGSLVGGTGYQAMCLDVLQLISVFRREWAALSSVTPVTSNELDRAEALAKEVSTTLGENEHATSPSSETADLRQRAYTLFVRTYGEVRRQVSYLRWAEGDVDDVVPSLFAGRKQRKADDEEELIGTPVSPTLVNDAPVPPGHPGGSPFVTP